MMVWTLRMAWRDSRGSRRRLSLFVMSMVLGVAALVSINSFGDNLRGAIDREARGLLGADMSLESRAPFPEEVEALIDSLGGSQAQRVSFSSMVLMPSGGDTRLATVRAVAGDYPFYGAIETDPADAAETYQRRGAALVDGSLMAQFGLLAGDSVRVGNIWYPVGGRLLKSPRESAAFSLISPRVYIPLAGIDSTLLSRGSRVEYETFFRFEGDVDVDALSDSLRPRLRALSVGIDTVSEVKRNWNRGLTNLYRFLGLVAVVALLLGSVGVASAIHVHVRQRVETVALLRCIGAPSRPTFGIYLVQAVVLGLGGSIVGAAVGSALQVVIPLLIREALPVEVPVQVSVAAALKGIAAGTGVTIAFALLPLLEVRRISPLAALRSARGVERRKGGVFGRAVVFAVVAAAVAAICVTEAPNWRIGLGYAAAVGVVFGAIGLVASGVVRGVRKALPRRSPYVLRQGLSNLYRPNNQTRMLLLALGLGTFLISTLYIVQMTLINQVEVIDREGRPNLVFFDIQPDQVDGVATELQQLGLSVMEDVPIVTMRLAAVKGRSITELREDSTYRVTWAHRREYRSTYRDVLSESEEIVEGGLVPGPPAEGQLPQVSLEEEIATELGVGVGDSLDFDVQGVTVPTVVGSLRRVDWQRLQTNFFVVFPSGVLEKAPRFNVLVTRTDDEATSGTAQAAVVSRYPNISAIDLSLILNVVDSVLSRVAFVVQFMALFSVVTGLIVLASAVLVSRVQRIEESVLLKTLGAARGQLARIFVTEYAMLGLLGALTGSLLAVTAGWVLSRFVFEATLVVPYFSLLLVVVVVIGVTLLIGLGGSRRVYRRSAMEVLRAEM
jgi:putative ABC transport system permease protein